jgi:2-haloacid dehalogenase
MTSSPHANEDAAEGLAMIRAAGFRMFAFSNGTADAVETLLEQAGLRGFFLDVVSVDEVKSFKPNPGVYAHFLRRAAAAGMRAAWVRRSHDALFDPWGIELSLTVANLVDLAARLDGQAGRPIHALDVRALYVFSFRPTNPTHFQGEIAWHP